MPCLVRPPRPAPVLPTLPALQMRVARRCLPVILASVQLHIGEAEVVAKGLIMLGVLGQVGAAMQVVCLVCACCCHRSCVPWHCELAVRGQDRASGPRVACQWPLRCTTWPHYACKLLSLPAGAAIPHCVAG